VRVKEVGENTTEADQHKVGGRRLEVIEEGHLFEELDSVLSCVSQREGPSMRRSARMEVTMSGPK